MASQFDPETFLSDFGVVLYFSIKFVFGSNLQPCLFYYRQSLYRKWQPLGLSCVKVIEFVSWVKQLMALPLLPTKLIHSLFYELSTSVLEINVFDAMAMFYSYFGKHWIQKSYKFKVNSAEPIAKSRVSVALSVNQLDGNVLNSGLVLFELRSVAKAYQLRENQLKEDILARRDSRKMSKASHDFFSEAEEKNPERIENDMHLMTSDDTLECFENESDEEETDSRKSFACELEKNCAKSCRNLMCTFCIEEDECLKCHTKIDSKVAVFFELWVNTILFCYQLIFRVCSILVKISDEFCRF